MGAVLVIFGSVLGVIGLVVYFQRSDRQYAPRPSRVIPRRPYVRTPHMSVDDVAVVVDAVTDVVDVAVSVADSMDTLSAVDDVVDSISDSIDFDFGD